MEIFTIAKSKAPQVKGNQKHQSIAVGDYVDFTLSDDNIGSIHAIHDRKITSFVAPQIYLSIHIFSLLTWIWLF